MNFEANNSLKTEYGLKEVSSITGVKPYVLRFWENEFQEISPSISEDGEKKYSSKDLDYVQNIKKLLFDDKLSIDQVKFILAGGDVSSLYLENLPKKKDVPTRAALKSEAKNTLDIQKEELNFSLQKKEDASFSEATQRLYELKAAISEIIAKYDWK